MLILFSGKMGCGKTVASKFLVNNFDFIRIAFGDAVKEEASEAGDFPLELCYTEEGKESEFIIPQDTLGQLMELGFIPSIDSKWTVRKWLQWYGTDFRRAQDENYWTKKGIQKILKAMEAGKDIVVDDVRFPDELMELKKLKALTVRLEPYPNWESSGDSTHDSETALDNMLDQFDVVYRPPYGALDAVSDSVLLYATLIKDHKYDA